MLENRAQPERDLATLDDVRGRTGVEIEDDRSRAQDFIRVRKRGVQLDRAQVRDPDQGGEIIAKNVIDVALIALAPDGRGLYPIGTMFSGIFFKKRFFVDAIR